LYHTTWLISKLDLLRYICEKPYLSSRITRWQVLLAEYDIVYMTRKAMKGSVIADHLADYCDVAVAQINYPSFKYNTQDSIEQARGRSHEEVSSQIFMLYVM
jgi:hypothetical protein